MGTNNIKRALRALRGFARRFHIVDLPPTTSTKRILQGTEWNGDRHTAFSSLSTPSKVHAVGDRDIESFDSAVSHEDREHSYGNNKTPMETSPPPLEPEQDNPTGGRDTDTSLPYQHPSDPPPLSSTTGSLPTGRILKSPRYDCPVCGIFDPRLHGSGKDIQSSHINATVAEEGEENHFASSGKPDLALPLSLLWEAEAVYPDDETSQHARRPRAGPTSAGCFAPSWSPRSVTCPVRRYDGTMQNPRGDHVIAICRVLDVTCALASLDASEFHPGHPVQSGRSAITVQGLVCEVKCRVDPGSSGEEQLQNVEDSNWSVSVRLAQDILPPRSMAERWDRVEERLVFLPVIYRRSPVGEMPHNFTIEGLALRTVAGMADWFTRVGIMALRFGDPESRESYDRSWKDVLGVLAPRAVERVITII